MLYKNNVYIMFKLLPYNYQLSKSIVHEIKLFKNIIGDMAVINNFPYSDRYFNTDWRFEIFRRGKPMGTILV